MRSVHMPSILFSHIRRNKSPLEKTRKHSKSLIYAPKNDALFALIKRIKQNEQRQQSRRENLNAWHKTGCLMQIDYANSTNRWNLSFLHLPLTSNIIIYMIPSPSQGQSLEEGQYNALWHQSPTKITTIIRTTARSNTSIVALTSDTPTAPSR